MNRWLACGVVGVLLLQSCASATYSVQSKAKGVTGQSITKENSFSAKWNADSVVPEDRVPMFDGLLDAFKEAGLKPAGPTGSDYIVSVIITKTDWGFMDYLERLVTALLSAVTLVIVPFVIPDNLMATVQVEDTKSQKKVAEFTVPMGATTCVALSPLAYLCPPNATSAGRSLGREITNNIHNISVTPQ